LLRFERNAASAKTAGATAAGAATTAGVTTAGVTTTTATAAASTAPAPRRRAIRAHPETGEVGRSPSGARCRRIHDHVAFRIARDACVGTRVPLGGSDGGTGEDDEAGRQRNERDRLGGQ
jgi:hypothetical protein